MAERGAARNLVHSAGQSSATCQPWQGYPVHMPIRGRWWGTQLCWRHVAPSAPLLANGRKKPFILHRRSASGARARHGGQAHGDHGGCRNEAMLASLPWVPLTLISNDSWKCRSISTPWAPFVGRASRGPDSRGAWPDMTNCNSRRRLCRVLGVRKRLVSLHA